MQKRNDSRLKKGENWLEMAKNKRMTKQGIRKSKIEYSEVSQHNKEDDCWIVLEGKVYDISKFLEYHPGGSLSEYYGKDMTNDFKAMHNTSSSKVDYKKFFSSCYIGELKHSKQCTVS